MSDPKEKSCDMDKDVLREGQSSKNENQDQSPKSSIATKAEETLNTPIPMSIIEAASHPITISKDEPPDSSALPLIENDEVKNQPTSRNPCLPEMESAKANVIPQKNSESSDVITEGKSFSNSSETICLFTKLYIVHKCSLRL